MMDDQRDIAEEAANRALMHEEDIYEEPDFEAQHRAYAQQVHDWYWITGSHNSLDISASDMYNHMKDALKCAIGIAYPELSETDIKEVYELCVDNGESLEYCVDYYKNQIQD